MRASISIIIGMLIIYICYRIIKREFDGAIVKLNSKYGYINDENTRELLLNLETIENTVNELNRSFYEIVSELEGKFSIHDKEIEILNEKVDKSNSYFETNVAKISEEIIQSKKSLGVISSSQKNTEKMLEKTIIQNKEVGKEKDLKDPAYNNISNK